MQDKFISTSRGKVHAMVAGSGDAVLLIHGYSVRDNSWRTWEKNINSLSAKCRVYALDLLGYGDSDKPEPRLNAKDEAKALVELMDAEGIARATAVGLSWGGGVAQTMASTWPDRIDKLVLVDSAYDDSERGRSSMQRIKCPTLILWDQEDQVIPVEGAAILGQWIQNARVRILKSAERDPDADPENRHWSQMTHSAAWNRAVAEFIGG